ncbi:anterior pharynx in excess protein 1 [Drosophila tropicalis]|uniref:anterior pharynx in excess protein 1 n=1 Tax=Drosophila tropicalis TaxID=46794 RepID=UPI0035ABB3BB
MKIVFGLCLLLSPIVATSIRENYCERNVTSRTVVPVIKTRTIVKKPSKWTPWKKTEKKFEEYTAYEEQITHKLVSDCCVGYHQVESGLCEPICERGCPAHASCVAPQRCQCTTGYVSALDHRDGSHYCEPICERSCSKGSQCVAPNTCSCREGYKQLSPAGDGVSGDCVPTCQLGDGCANGKCIDVERCECIEGYDWDENENKCKEIAHVASVEEEEEPMSTTNDIPPTSEECSEGFVLYGGQCRPETFDSNEAEVKDCRIAGCVGHHQVCSDLGSCICAEGYVQENDAEQNSTLSCRRGILEELLSIDQAADEDNELNPWTIPIIGLASGSLFVLLLAGLIGGVRHHRQRRDQSENEALPKEPVLQCEYSKKSYDVDEWVP